MPIRLKFHQFESFHLAAFFLEAFQCFLLNLSLFMRELAVGLNVIHIKQYSLI